jgi:GT2 family glycosyltransferase
MNLASEKAKRIAAFIITFERPDTLIETIKCLFNQTLPPEKILIVDNSISNKTEAALTNFDSRVSYHRVGYNSGPAGGARIGLDILAKEGYKWIFWGDDDDPPPTLECLDQLISLAESYQGKCGQVGLVGHRFNKFTGTFIRTENDELYKGTYVEVDSIGGGMCKVINSEIVNNGVLPEEKLFFGFEDLDFDLATKKAGYNIIAHSQLFLFCRQRANRMNYKHTINRRKDESRIWRDYYSIRNQLFIMKKNKLYTAFLSNVAIAVIKSVLSYKYGMRYGNLTTKITMKAFRDYTSGKYYKRELN